MSKDAKNRIYELVERHTDLKAKERVILNNLDTVRRQISEIEIEFHQIIELNKKRTP